MASATIKPAAREWIALRDGIGHEQDVRPRAGTITRTACGKPRIDPRYAHPVTARCQACIDRLAGA